MPHDIKGIGEEKAMFERGNEIYWVELIDGRVTKVSCVDKHPTGVLHGYERIGRQYFGDSFFDHGCAGMTDMQPIKPSEVPRYVKKLLMGEKEATLKEIQNLDSRYWKKREKNN